MAFGTDDEKALVGGFNETFQRDTHLLCEIHLRKNIDTKLVSMDIKGESEQSIMDDTFGRKIGSVFESGLSDAGSSEEFIGLFESLEEKWSLLHSNGKAFHSWVDSKKTEEFIRYALSVPFVRMLASVAHQTNSQTIDLNVQTMSFRTA